MLYSLANLAGSRLHTGHGGDSHILDPYVRQPWRGRITGRTRAIETAMRWYYAAREGAVVGTVLGVSVDGVIFTPMTNWQPDAPVPTDDGFTDITIVPWAGIRALCCS